MLGLRSVGQLAAILGTSPRRLYEVGDRINDFVQHYELSNPSHPVRKSRIVLCPTGAWRRFQVLLLRRLFRQKLRPSPYSFGGVPGRNAVQNASSHLRSRFVYTTDIRDFFPSISVWRLQDLFAGRLRCSPGVSQLLTRLCTYDNHLAQGLITSPILADQAVGRVDKRIAGVCRQHGLVYTRFVDDVTVSGPFPLGMRDSGIVALVRRILNDCGFQIAEHKEQAGPLGEGDIAITGLRAVRGHLDVTDDYVRRLESHIDAHRVLGLGGEFTGVLFTRDQLTGRVEYVCSINPGRSKPLRRRLGLIDWERVVEHAADRGLMVCRKQLIPVTG